ncbi:MAG: TetR family transcriptional regulator [Vibrio sp.]
MKKIKSRTRLPPEIRKQQLLETGFKVFARRGIGRGGHADIAEMAQVSVATVFNYFPTREELVEEILSDVEQKFSNFLATNIDSELPLKMNLQNITHQLIDGVLADSQWIKIWFEWSTSTRADVWPLFVAMHGKHQKNFRALFANAIKTGEFNPDFNPSHAAKLFHGLCYSTYIQANRKPHRQYLQKLADSFLNMLCIYNKE